MTTGSPRLLSTVARLTRTMSTLSVSPGLSQKLALPHAQIVIVGTKPYLRNLAFSEPLVSKLAGVDEKVFKAALEQLSGTSSVPLYLNLAKIVSIPSECSRHNSPSNSDNLFRELKSTSIVDGVKTLSIILYSPYEHLLAHVAAIAKAFPSYTRKTTTKKGLEEIKVEIVVTDDKTLSDADVKFLQTLGEHMRICAQQVDAPCNEFHSKVFADDAVKLIDNLGVPIEKTIIVGEALKEQGFGGIYHVGKAAINPPVFAAFSHKPAGATKTFALVGKGIVYDTGGMQIKTKTGMPGMKQDMAGAAALLGAFCTLVRSGFKENLSVLLCIAENNISPVANKPDDIITMLSGKTVEINNTDAEGRLVLADGVYYAKTKLNANVIIDMATLTGAQMYATGKLHAGVLTNSDEWELKATRAGRASGDLVHPFVFAPDLHFGDLKSPLADMKNSNLGSTIGPPSSIAGLFIASHIDFAKGLDWLHFDIAYPAQHGERGTAYGVPLICRLLGEYTDVGVTK
uniref:CYTOSOL_AP domain-containing protein n=1 Tax=Panagrellus redivivus TaxID=6233 RepID=A0A7E4VIZ0_PANRE